MKTTTNPKASSKKNYQVASDSGHLYTACLCGKCLPKSNMKIVFGLETKAPADYTCDLCGR